MGESKAELLSAYAGPSGAVARTFLIAPGEPAARAERALTILGRKKLTLPIILNPKADENC